MSERAAQKILTTARAHTSKTHKISFGSVGWWKSNIHPTYVCSLVCLSICLSFFFIDSATMPPPFLPLCVCVTLFMHSTIRKLGIFAGFQPIDIGFIPIAILKLLFDASREFWWRKQLHENQFFIADCNIELKVTRRKLFSSRLNATTPMHTWFSKAWYRFNAFFLLFTYALRTTAIGNSDDNDGGDCTSRFESKIYRFLWKKMREESVTPSHSMVCLKCVSLCYFAVCVRVNFLASN